MLADHAADVLAVAAGLGAEAGSVGAEADGELGLVEGLVAEEVGDGDLGGGNQVEAMSSKGTFRDCEDVFLGAVRFPVHVALHFVKVKFWGVAGRVVKVFLELRQLAGAEQ